MTLWRVTIAGLFALAAIGCGEDGDSAAGEVPADAVAEIAGVTVVPGASASHVDGTVEYPTDPPAGGNHNAAWQNCGFYSVEVEPELAVHSLEHGAVWVTFAPDTAPAIVDTIEALAATSDFVLASPNPGNPAPVVLTAWGRQVGVDSLDDPIVASFLDTYLEDGPTTPEPGASCAGAVGVPPDQPLGLAR
jgi:hypothetical protein